MLSAWIQEQRPKVPTTDNTLAFYRNLEEGLNARRSEQSLLTLKLRENDCIDFSSNDLLSLSSSGLLRQAFLDELARNPGFPLGAGGSRLMDGNYEYIEKVEQEIADFHGADKGVVVSTGWEANVAVLSAIPRPGDAIVFDELVHSSSHEGMRLSLAQCKLAFRHNNVDSFRDVLLSIRESQPLIRQGSRSVLICVESVYSMEGDMSPLTELVPIAKEIFPSGNAQFVVDEAHTTGIVGKNGAGFVCMLGLEREIAIRVHTFGKSLGSAGAIILGNDTIKTMLLNHSRSIIYTTAPSFPMIASIRSGYQLMKAGKTKEAQANIQRLVKHFYTAIMDSTVWNDAIDEGIISVPLTNGLEELPFLSHIVPIFTRPRYNYYLFFHLRLAKISAFPIDYPIVPKGASRIRLTFHGNNTIAEVDQLVTTIGEWAQEMLDLEVDGYEGSNLPSAARQVYGMAQSYS